MARPYIQWDPDLLRGRATPAIHGPFAADAAALGDALGDLFLQLALPIATLDPRVGYLRDQIVRQGGPAEPARGLGRLVPAYMPAGITFWGADPAHGEPLPIDPSDPVGGIIWPYVALGWRAPLRGWTASRSEGNFQGEWRLRWGDPVVRANGDPRGAWTGLVLALYHPRLRRAQHIILVGHGKRPHDASWVYGAAHLDDPLGFGPIAGAAAVADGLDQGYVRVVVSGASPWTVTLEYGDGATWTTLLTTPVDFLSLVPPGEEDEVGIIAGPFCGAAEVRPAFPAAYPMQEHWIDDLVAPSFTPWVADVADWSMRELLEQLFAPPPLVYDPGYRRPRTDLLLPPPGSVAAPAEAPVFVDGFGAGVRFGAASHGFALANEDARIAADATPLSAVERLLPCDVALGGRDAPFAIALEILPEDMASWPATARIWGAGAPWAGAPAPGTAGVGLYWRSAGGGELVVRACDEATWTWAEAAIPFAPADYEGRHTVVALAWTGGAGATVGRPSRELRVVVDGLHSEAILVGAFRAERTTAATVGAPVPDGTADGFIGVLGRAAWFLSACSDADLGLAAFEAPGAGFLNPSFEDPSDSGRPGEAAHWEWRSLQADGGWAEFNAFALALDRWRTAAEGFEAAWDANEGWADDLVVTALAAALFNAASPTYYGTLESFEVWGYRDDSVAPPVPYPGPNWLDAVAYRQPCEEVPPTGFLGWYDDLMGTHDAPLEIDGFEEAWGTDPLSAAGQPWWPGTAPTAVLRGAPLTFPVTLPPDRNVLAVYRDLDATVHRLTIPAGAYATAAALAAAVDGALGVALGPGRLVACAPFLDAEGRSGLALGWDEATLGAESIWLGTSEADRWRDARGLLGLRTLGPGGACGAVRYPAALLPTAPVGYSAADVFLLDPWSLLDFYTAYDANCGGWFAIPYGMLGALFDTALAADTFAEMFTLTGWVGPAAAWIDDLDPGLLAQALFDSGANPRETFLDTNWPNWVWT